MLKEPEHMVARLGFRVEEIRVWFMSIEQEVRENRRSKRVTDGGFKRGNINNISFNNQGKVKLWE